MSLPVQTRLRFVSSKDPQALVEYCQGLRFRIQIYSIAFDTSAKKWFLWFVPVDDPGLDVPFTGSLD